MKILLAAIVVAALLSACAVKIYIRSRREYTCPRCGLVFRPRFSDCFRLLLNFPEGGAALKCPKCGEKSIMREKE